MTTPITDYIRQLSVLSTDMYKPPYIKISDNDMEVDKIDDLKQLWYVRSLFLQMSLSNFKDKGRQREGM